MTLWQITLRLLALCGAIMLAGASRGLFRGPMLLVITVGIVWIAVAVAYLWIHLLRHAPNTCATITALGIIGTMAVCLLLPGLNKIREDSRSTACKYTLKELGIDLTVYWNLHQDFEQKREPYIGFEAEPSGPKP